MGKDDEGRNVNNTGMFSWLHKMIQCVCRESAKFLTNLKMCRKSENKRWLRKDSQV